MACEYQGCGQRYQAFTSINFFSLPSDNRRDLWIQNSGNSKLKTIPTSKKVRFCEAHFDPKYFRRQFNRTTLRRDAVPYSYYETLECCPSPENIPINISDIMPQEPKGSIDIRNETPASLVTVVEITSLLDAKTRSTFPHENFLAEDFLEDPVDLEEIIEPFNHNESMNEEIVFAEMEKTFIDSCTQTNDIVPTYSTIMGDYDEDEHFVLSLIGPLRRLPNHMKISARLSILEIIARCESQSNKIK